MKCANCNRPGLYVYEGPGVRPVAYCTDDLPGFLRGAAKSGALRTTEAFDRVRQSALNALSPDQVVTADPEPDPAPEPKKNRRKKAEPAVEEPAPVEDPAEPAVEDAVGEPTEG